jgi:hypothetical protein
MEINLREYSETLKEHNVYVVYNGPIWANGIDGIAELLIKRLEFDDLSLSASQSVFSVFVEQINNMMMYSAEKDIRSDNAGNQTEIKKGIFVLGIKNSEYFVRTGNYITDKNAEILKKRIDHLNSLDKKELRKYHKQQLHAENDNDESKGAGIGLTEIARRASDPIKYVFEPSGGGLQYFSMYITIRQGQKGGQE